MRDESWEISVGEVALAVTLWLGVVVVPFALGVRLAWRYPLW